MPAANSVAFAVVLATNAVVIAEAVSPDDATQVERLANVRATPRRTKRSRRSFRPLLTRALTVDAGTPSLEAACFWLPLSAGIPSGWQLVRRLRPTLFGGRGCWAVFRPCCCRYASNPCFSCAYPHGYDLGGKLTLTLSTPDTDQIE